MEKVKEKVYIVVAIVLVMGLAFSAGLYTGKSKVEIQEKVVEKIVYQDKIQIVEKVVTVHIKDVSEKKAVDIKRETIKTPDGTVVIKEEEKTRESKETKEKEVVTEFKVIEVEKIVYQDRVVEKLVSKTEADWHLGLNLGVSIREIDLASAVSEQPWVAGLTADRRVLGPFFVGAWADTNLSGGLRLGAEF